MFYALCVCFLGAPLFDSSSNFTDPQTMQLLQHSQRLLSNLSTIFHCLLSEAQELTQKGAVSTKLQSHVMYWEPAPFMHTRSSVTIFFFV